MSAAYQRESRYMVNPADRLRELLHVEEIPETAELHYSFSQGYERMTYRSSERSGSVEFQGAYHPDEGYCIGPGICRYCGRTLFDD